jgi:hypothetical protein
LFHVDVSRLVSLATEEEKPIRTDTKNFWHARAFYSTDVGTDKDFGGRPPSRQLRRDRHTAATICG